jgi:hypothetical protein
MVAMCKFDMIVQFKVAYNSFHAICKNNQNILTKIIYIVHIIIIKEHCMELLCDYYEILWILDVAFYLYMYQIFMKKMQLNCTFIVEDM